LGIFFSFFFFLELCNAQLAKLFFGGEGVGTICPMINQNLKKEDTGLPTPWFMGNGRKPHSIFLNSTKPTLIRDIGPFREFSFLFSY
jgi:hypothetical protein